jgi:hypothetical protein
MPLSLLASIGFKPAPHPPLHLTQPYGARDHPLIPPTAWVRLRVFVELRAMSLAASNCVSAAYNSLRLTARH